MKNDLIRKALMSTERRSATPTIAIKSIRNAKTVFLRALRNLRLKLFIAPDLRGRNPPPKMGLSLFDVVALLSNLSGLAAKLAQIIKLCSSNISARDKLNFIKNWSVNWPGSLYTNLERYLTNGEGLANTVSGTTDYNSLEKLNTAAATLNDIYVNLDGVAGSKIWNVVS
jgi:hypothetical protein